MSTDKKTPSVISSTDLQRGFGNILRRIYVDKEHLIIERDGLPVAVILPVNEYENLVKSQKKTKTLRLG